MKVFDCSFRAKGVFAIGITATGVVAIGVNSFGIISIGFTSFGLISIGVGFSFGLITIALGFMISYWASGIGIAISVLPCFIGAGYCTSSFNELLGIIAVITFLLFAILEIFRIRAARRSQLSKEIPKEERLEMIKAHEAQIIDVNYIKRNIGISGVIKGEIIDVKEGGQVIINLFEYQCKRKEKIFCKGNDYVEAKQLFEKQTPNYFGDRDHICYFSVTGTYIEQNLTMDSVKLKELKLESNYDDLIETKLEKIEENHSGVTSTPDADSENSSTTSEFSDVALECHTLLIIPQPQNVSCLPFRKSYDWIFQFWETQEKTSIATFWTILLTLPFALLIFVLQLYDYIEIPSYWYW